MKLKLDENLDIRLARVLERAGHDVATVLGQRLGGRPDEDLFRACKTERRILVSQDMDFGNVLRFPPESTAGIVVLRGPDQLLTTTRRLLANLVVFLEQQSPAGALWIVESRRVRIYRPRDE